MSKHTIGAGLQVAGMITLAAGAGLAAGLWAGLLVAGLFAVGVGVLLEREGWSASDRVQSAPPAGRQPTTTAVTNAIKRKFSRTYRDPRGGRLTTAPPPEEAGSTDPTAEEVEALKTNWIVRQ